MTLTNKMDDFDFATSAIYSTPFFSNSSPVGLFGLHMNTHPFFGII